MSWRNLLEWKRSHMLMEDTDYIYRMIYILGLESTSSKPKDTFMMLDLYIRDSSLGTFDHRLESLKILIETLPQSKLTNSIGFIMNYYGQFKGLLDSTISRLSADAQSKVKT